MKKLLALGFLLILAGCGQGLRMMKGGAPGLHFSDIKPAPNLENPCDLFPHAGGVRCEPEAVPTKGRGKYKSIQPKEEPPKLEPQKPKPIPKTIPKGAITRTVVV